MKLFKHITIGSLFVFAIALLVWQNQEASSASGRFSLLAATSTASGLGTTTVKYLDPATSKATSTLEFASANTDHIDLNIQYNASSTNSTLQFTVEHSDDQVDWFCAASKPVTTAGTTTLETYGARCPIHQWTPGKTGISRTSIPLTDLGTKFMRIRFTSKDGNGSLWAQPIQRYPN